MDPLIIPEPTTERIPDLCPDCWQPNGQLVRPHYLSAIPCEKCQRTRSEARLVTANLPLTRDGSRAGFLNFKPANESQDAAMTRCQALAVAGDPWPGLFLRGPNGVGKSHLAAATIGAVIIGGAVGKFITFAALVSEIQETYHKSPRSAESVIDSYAPDPMIPPSGYPRFRWLAIDDLADSPPTWHSAQILFRVLNDRVTRRLPTIITANYSAPEMMKRLTARDCDESMATRILERVMELCRPCAMDGTSYRREMTT
jgi:DNA replication protein DnaC